MLNQYFDQDIESKFININHVKFGHIIDLNNIPKKQISDMLPDACCKWCKKFIFHCISLVIITDAEKLEYKPILKFNIDIINKIKTSCTISKTPVNIYFMKKKYTNLMKKSHMKIIFPKWCYIKVTNGDHIHMYYKIKTNICEYGNTRFINAIDTCVANNELFKQICNKLLINPNLFPGLDLYEYHPDGIDHNDIGTHLYKYVQFYSNFTYLGRLYCMEWNQINLPLQITITRILYQCNLDAYNLMLPYGILPIVEEYTGGIINSIDTSILYRMYDEVMYKICSQIRSQLRNTSIRNITNPNNYDTYINMKMSCITS
jgi:hypothetical protein